MGCVRGLEVLTEDKSNVGETEMGVASPEKSPINSCCVTSSLSCDDTWFCRAARACVLDLRGARLVLLDVFCWDIPDWDEEEISSCEAIGTAPSTGIDRQVVNVAGCLFENSVSKASEEREALPSAGVRGERPRRDGDPRKEFGGETVCIKQQMNDNNCYRQRERRVIVSESFHSSEGPECVGAGIEIVH